MVKFYTTATTLLAFVLAACAAPQRSGSPPSNGLPVITDPPPGFNITSLGVNGSGCPPGSAYYLLNEAKTAVTVSFSQYFAEVGPGSLSARTARIANLLLVFRFLEDFLSALPLSTTAVTTNLTKPSLLLSSRSTTSKDKCSKLPPAQTSSGQLMVRMSSICNTSSSLRPFPYRWSGATYTYRDSFDLVATVTSPCGAPAVLNIVSDLRASNTKNTKGSGYIATDSIDTALQQTFGFQWLKC
ncbi:hypothetical protein D9613_007917 [Agrocybe pediades]|uniref:Uncharacterized protein n=1 Tax=Agrocybe pediades TaxID=84607 RepID=A0A8H4QN78_9AGAR|nr:hypothetical protein D9613_007917 [Agrocybe pediades]